ncbi:hypothetical protein MD484_g7787, partial [Candolleomyces efflorescens]
MSPPALADLLLTSTFLYLLQVSSHLSTLLTNTDLLGPLSLGILWCSPALPPPAPLLPQEYLPFLSFLGYVGLILLIFDAGLSTPAALLLNLHNLAASLLVGLTGILVPIALSLALFHAAFRFSLLTSFAAGAALCSTSLGTTVSLLSGDMKKSRLGVVLVTAALFDDIVGLMIAGVIANLVPSSTGGGSGIHWSTIARPILVSVAFALGTPVLALIARRLVVRGRAPFPVVRHRMCSALNIKPTHVHLFVIVSTLLAFVATSHLAGTSELFGAYLAGAFLGHVFAPQDEDDHSENPMLETFTSQISNKLLHPLLSPLFFASIGASIPVDQLFAVQLPTAAGAMVKSHRVVWRGIVYSLLMVLAKAISGVWVFVFWKKAKPTKSDKKNEESDNATLTLETKKPTAAASTFINDAGPETTPKSMSGSNSPDVDEPQTKGLTNAPRNGSSGPHTTTSRLPTALLLGLAMVARGEIALVVAQLARPLLVDDQGGLGGSEEPYVLVMWAILLTTFGGAFGVGLVVRWMKRSG